DEAGSPATVASMGGRFFGGVVGGALPVSVAAHWLADAWDQNACLFDIGDDEKTARVIDAIQAEGTCWCGGTVWKERKAMRISVSSWATTDSDVTRSLEAILRIAAAGGRSGSSQREPVR
ncbi:MAG TPA: hypothetical protein VGX94_17535, partial [Terriglobia bacterium]|nr:hypothetical protein [Terriglobia bacterium]